MEQELLQPQQRDSMTTNPYQLPTKLNTMKGRIAEILKAVPQSRSSDKILLIEYMKAYGPFCYDEASKKLQFKAKDGVTYEEWLCMPSTESICRLKRFIQLEARERMAHGKATADDADMLPSEKVQIQRTILEGINKIYFYRG
jgi:hypothetical protein